MRSKYKLRIVIAPLSFRFRILQLIDQIEIILIAISQVVNHEITVQLLWTKYGKRKRKLLRDYHDTSRMGRALLDRMALPVIVDGL